MPSWYESRPVYHLLKFVASLKLIRYHFLNYCRKRRKYPVNLNLLCIPLQSAGKQTNTAPPAHNRATLRPGWNPNMCYTIHTWWADLKKNPRSTTLRLWTSAFVSSLFATHWLLTPRHIPTYLRFWLVERDHSGVCFSSFRRIITT